MILPVERGAASYHHSGGEAARHRQVQAWERRRVRPEEKYKFQSSLDIGSKVAWGKGENKRDTRAPSYKLLSQVG